MFKHNQKIRFIKHDLKGWAKRSNFKIGQVYTVNYVEPTGWVLLKENSTYFIPPECFELAYKTNRKSYHPEWF